MADTAKYRVVTTIEFDREVKDPNLRKINELLSQGWEIVDARIVQVTAPQHPNPAGNANWFQYEEYCFVLGNPR